jgi:microcystin-dependent protein
VEPFIGQIMWAGFDFAPEGWALCNGALLSIVQNEALFSLLGTTYGGDGRVDFALPNLGGAAAFGTSPSFQAGQALGPLGGPAAPGAPGGLVVPATIALVGYYPPRD